MYTTIILLYIRLNIKCVKFMLSIKLKHKYVLRKESLEIKKTHLIPPKDLYKIIDCFRKYNFSNLQLYVYLLVVFSNKLYCLLNIRARNDMHK